MYPVGIFFIIFPLNLINPHSVMNLEVSIKHIITNQHRAGGSWRHLAAMLGVCVVVPGHSWQPGPDIPCSTPKEDPGVISAFSKKE